MVYPQSEREEAAARLETFRKVKPLADVLAHYGGNHEEFVELFKANCEFIGIKEGQALGTASSGSDENPEWPGGAPSMGQ